MHTTFSDGKNTPEEMVQEAIRKGLDTVGISDHSSGDPCGMTLAASADYKAEIRLMKERGPERLYLLWGPEDYLREQYLLALKAFCLPEGEDASFFLCKELKKGYLDGVSGGYQTPQGYYISDADVEEFDKAFAPKVKERLPGQIFD